MTISKETLQWIQSNNIVAIERADRYRTSEDRRFNMPTILVKLVANSGDTRMIRWDDVSERTLVVDIAAPSIISLHPDVNLNKE